MTGKQRAFLRKMANGLDAKYQIGKDGIDDETVKMVDLALEANELIKIKVLQNSDFSAKELCSQILEEVDCEPVQVIGNTIVLYAYSHKKNIKHIQLD